MRTQPIMLIAALSNQENEIILQKEFEFSGIYHVRIANKHEAEVLKTPKGTWEVVPHTKSWLTGEDCDVILKTVLNLENPNF